MSSGRHSYYNVTGKHELALPIQGLLGFACYVFWLVASTVSWLVELAFGGITKADFAQPNPMKVEEDTIALDGHWTV